MIDLIKYVLQIKQKCVQHDCINVDLMEKNLIQIIGGIIDVKTILFSVLLHVVVKMEKI